MPNVCPLPLPFRVSTLHISLLADFLLAVCVCVRVCLANSFSVFPFLSLCMIICLLRIFFASAPSVFNYFPQPSAALVSVRLTLSQCPSNRSITPSPALVFHPSAVLTAISPTHSSLFLFFAISPDPRGFYTAAEGAGSAQWRGGKQRSQRPSDGVRECEGE